LPLLATKFEIKNKRFSRIYFSFQQNKCFFRGNKDLLQLTFERFDKKQNKTVYIIFICRLKITNLRLDSLNKRFGIEKKKRKDIKFPHMFMKVLIEKEIIGEIKERNIFFLNGIVIVKEDIKVRREKILNIYNWMFDEKYSVKNECVKYIFLDVIILAEAFSNFMVLVRGELNNNKKIIYIEPFKILSLSSLSILVFLNNYYRELKEKIKRFRKKEEEYGLVKRRFFGGNTGVRILGMEIKKVIYYDIRGRYACTIKNILPYGNYEKFDKMNISKEERRNFLAICLKKDYIFFCECVVKVDKEERAFPPLPYRDKEGKERYDVYFPTGR